MADDAPAQKPTVAFLGPPSSFTHEATKAAFPEAQHAYMPVAAIEDVFDAVQAGAAALGVVPFENSTHGVVAATLEALADRAGAHAALRVCGEVCLDVHHFLLGYKQPQPAAPPATTRATPAGVGVGVAAASSPSPSPSPPPPQSLDHVRRVLSHPQALAQTRAFVRARLRRGVECVATGSTSAAAAAAARDGSGATAAVAGAGAAAQFGLDVLAARIEDRADNATRFFVLRREAGAGGLGRAEEAAALPLGGRGSGGGGGGARRHKSLVSFRVPRGAPGALARVLAVFGARALELTSINSLPSLVRPFEYLFFVEFEGSRHHDPDGRVRGALEEIGAVAEGWRWWGSWESVR